MLKTLFILFLFYVLVKVISSVFLSNSGKKKSNFRFFYNTFKNVRDQQRSNQQQQRKRSGKVNQGDLDNIEEAEYEEVSEEEPSNKG